MPGESEAQEAESRLRTASAPLLLLSGPHKETRFLASAMVDIARRDGGAFVDLRVPPQLPPVAPAELRRAVAAYQEFDYERAMRHLGIAFSELANSGVQTVSNSELCDLFIYRALVRNAQGDTSKSWNDFVQAALIDPTRHLDAVRFSPSVAASFERARKAVIDGPAHLLSVELLSVERSDDCRLIVDGLERGRHTAVSLRAGRHFLQLSCAGYRDYSEEVLVDKDLSLRPRLEKPKTPSLVEAPALATERGFRHVVFVQVPFTSPKNTALFVLMGADGNELGRTSMMLAATSDDKPVAMTALSRLLDLLTPRSSVPLVVVQQRSWYQTPWIWAVAGAVATSAVLLPFALRDQSNTGFRIELGGETP
tara:strand:+ start:40462 stop:41562 length:1101 start_codon:yes stop_codon:yes gene_type:complete